MGLSRRKVKQWIEDGRLRARQDGGSECSPWFITEKRLQEDLDRLYDDEVKI
jgi:hypothetical protein